MADLFYRVLGGMIARALRFEEEGARCLFALYCSRPSLFLFEAAVVCAAFVDLFCQPVGVSRWINRRLRLCR